MLTPAQHIAKVLHNLQQGFRSVSATPQLAASSVEDTDGTEIPVVESLIGAVDTAESLVQVQDQANATDDVVGEATEYQVGIPGWTNQVSESVGHSLDIAVYAGMKAAGAQQEAEAAAQEAAGALENSYGNARYRYFPSTGEYVPELPEGGPRENSERIHVDDQGHPFQVDVFDGAEWNRFQLLTDQVLVLGEDGTVQIENGRIVAPLIVGGEIEGTEMRSVTMHSGTYYGGEFVQYASDDMVSIYPNAPGEVIVEDWIGGAPDALTPASASTTVYETGVKSAFVSRSGSGTLSALWRNNDRTPLLSATPRGVSLRVLVTSAVTGVHITTPGGTQELGDVPPGVWTSLVVDIPDDDSLDWVHIGVVTSANTTLYVDQVQVLATALTGTQMRIARSPGGMPGLFIYDADGELLGEFTPLGLRSLQQGGNREATLRDGSLTLRDGAKQVQVTAKSGGIVPTGSTFMYAGIVAPDGYLMCDGSEVSRVVFSDLFSVVGVMYGAGDGTTTFNLPNYQERSPVGYKAGSSEFGLMGKQYGEKNHTLTVSEMPSHNHGGSTGGSAVDSTFATNLASTNPTDNARIARGGTSNTDTRTVIGSGHTHGISSQGGGGAHNNVHPVLVSNFIIKF